MATIKDVARLAGVGLGTASRLVSGKGAVSPATQARVRAAIEQLGFRPSHAARTLLSGHSQMIGVYIPVLSGTFYTPLLHIIDTELRAAGLHMVVAFGAGLGGARQQAVDGLAFLVERGCDGLILMSNALRDEDLATLGPRPKPLVLLNHSLAGVAAHCFTVDHARGGALAARTLLDHGHRDIALVAGPASLPDNVARVHAFQRALAAAGIDPAQVWTVEKDFSPAGGWSAASELMASGRRCTAMFCANDEMAAGALAYFQEAGVRVPQQISVLGYDDTPTAEFSAPRLSTVHMPWREMTQNGVSHLLNRCYGLQRPVTRDHPVTMTLRASLTRASPA